MEGIYVVAVVICVGLTAWLAVLTRRLRRYEQVAALLAKSLQQVDEQCEVYRRSLVFLLGEAHPEQAKQQLSDLLRRSDLSH